MDTLIILIALIIISVLLILVAHYHAEYKAYKKHNEEIVELHRKLVEIKDTHITYLQGMNEYLQAKIDFENGES